MLEHQCDCKGNHRIVVDGNVGQPALYSSPAFAKEGEKSYVAVTDYYEGDLPRGVHEVTKVGEVNLETKAYNFFSEPDETCPHLGKEDTEATCKTCPQR